MIQSCKLNRVSDRSVFVLLVVGEPGAPAPGEAHRDAEAPPGGRCEPQRPSPADGSRHAAASHSRAGASARRAQEQPLPPHPPQHQIELINGSLDRL